MKYSVFQASGWHAYVGMLCFLVVSSCSPQKPEPPNRIDTINQKVEELLAQMTLEEKIGQMSQVRHFDDIKEGDVAGKFIGSVIHTDGPLPGQTPAEWQEKFKALQQEALSTRLGIPLLLGVDAIHGQNTFEGATIFPHNIGMGATGNAELVQKAAEVTATEVKATGLNWTFSPCIALPYNERWGRVYEGFSESTELTSELAKASVMGLQSNDAQQFNVMATAKHYIADGGTDYGKEGGESNVSTEFISRYLLPPYKAAVEQGVGAVMVGFNSLNGISMHAHKVLITDTLKQAMGFDGIVVTDWKGYSRFGRLDVINAGVDMVMAVDGDLDVFQSELKAAVEQNTVPMARIDDAVCRILRQKMRLDLFENPFPDSTLANSVGTEAHRAVARQAVQESMVLLKNKGNCLPITDYAQKIVVMGEHADNSGLLSGGWTIKWQGTDSSYKGASTLLQGIQKASKAEVVYDADGSENHEDADYIVLVVGEQPYAEFFGDVTDSSDCQLTLSPAQKDLVQRYAGKGPKLIVVLISGRPMVVSEELEYSDAFVAAWLPGSEASAMAEVLFGNKNFKGKLPHSWPASVEDYKGTYGPNYWDKASRPLFPLGYGLNYP